MKSSKKFEDLVKIMKILRQECPWDACQTHKSIKDHLIEEAYEVIEAIDRENANELKKELGDVLLHVVFHSEIATEENKFTVHEVIFAIQEKLIRRHPHVFGESNVKSKDEVAKNWEAVKMEKEGRQSRLDGIPAQLPALIRAQRMQEKAGSVGFDWKQCPEGKRQLWEKVREELNEFEEAFKNSGENSEQMAREYGDLLFSIVNAGRFLNLKAEDALRGTNQKFKKRFQYIEKEIHASGRTLQEASLEEMDALWDDAKAAEHH